MCSFLLFVPGGAKARGEEESSNTKTDWQKQFMFTTTSRSTWQGVWINMMYFAGFVVGILEQKSQRQTKQRRDSGIFLVADISK